MRQCICKFLINRKRVYERFEKNDKIWNFYQADLQLSDIKIFCPLIKISNTLEFIDFGINNNFNIECLHILIDCLYKNDSIKGLGLYLNNKTITMENYTEIFEVLKIKKNIVCLYLDKNIANLEKGIPIANNYKMASKGGSKNDNNIDGKNIKNMAHLLSQQIINKVL